MEFGELTRVAVSEVWPHEAHHFTPWLADNLDRLAKAIGIPLELEDTEVAVEGYSAVITATNRDHGHRVLIENQYGRTDHQHLGQILTYLAGLEAQTVVWISEEFTEPHLSAIRWLNEHTAEPFSFLAVRLSLVRITDSPIAPRFEVVERPNSWDPMVRASSHTGELSETGAFRREFWTYYSERYPEDVPQAYATSNVWVYVLEADFNIPLCWRGVGWVYFCAAARGRARNPSTNEPFLMRPDFAVTSTGPRTSRSGTASRRWTSTPTTAATGRRW